MSAEPRSGGMSEEAENFRRRADECRRLAAAARDEFARNLLTDTANDLEAEAEAIEAETRQTDA